MNERGEWPRVATPHIPLIEFHPPDRVLAARTQGLLMTARLTCPMCKAPSAVAPKGDGDVVACSACGQQFKAVAPKPFVPQPIPQTVPSPAPRPIVPEPIPLSVVPPPAPRPVAPPPLPPAPKKVNAPWYDARSRGPATVAAGSPFGPRRAGTRRRGRCGRGAREDRGPDRAGSSGPGPRFSCSSSRRSGRLCSSPSGALGQAGHEARSTGRGGAPKGGTDKPAPKAVERRPKTQAELAKLGRAGSAYVEGWSGGRSGQVGLLRPQGRAVRHQQPRRRESPEQRCPNRP